MARIRTIKPGFFSSLTVAEMATPTRLTFIGLWTYADDEGRAVDDARLVKAEIWPLDAGYTAKKVEADLARLADLGVIQRYEVDGKRYLHLTNWAEHQKINRPQKSNLPPPPCRRSDDSLNDHGAATDNSVAERKGMEGKVAPTSSAREDAVNDPVWDALLEACGLTGTLPTPSERGAWHKAAGDLRSIGATPAEIHRRAAAYRQRWPEVTMSPTALARRWNESVADPAAVEPRTIYR